MSINHREVRILRIELLCDDCGEQLEHGTDRGAYHGDQKFSFYCHSCNKVVLADGQYPSYAYQAVDNPSKTWPVEQQEN